MSSPRLLRDPVVPLLALGVVASVVVGFAPVTRELRSVVALAAQPLCTRLAVAAPWAAGELAVGREVAQLVPVTEPVVLDAVETDAWFVALALQPRRVYFDRPGIADVLEEWGSPPARLRVVGTADHTLRWRLVRPHEAPIFEDDFERGGVEWTWTREAQ